MTNNISTCFLDSNILIYFKDEASPHHKKAAEKLKVLMSAKTVFCISPLVLDEFIYVAQHIFKSPKKTVFYANLKKILEEVLEIPNLQIINPTITYKHQLKIIDYMKEYNLYPRDAYHLLTMTENEITAFATFDNDFDKVFSSGLLSKA